MFMGTGGLNDIVYLKQPQDRSGVLEAVFKKSYLTNSVCTYALTCDSLECQKFNILPSRVGRAVVLGECTAVLLACAFHLLCCLWL